MTEFAPYSASFPPDRQAPDAARAAVGHFSTAASITPRVRMRGELVAEELVANTLMHGQPAPDSLIELHLSRTEDALEMIYVDRGRRFDPSALGTRPRQDLWQVGGYGWELVHGLCQSVRYERVGETNRLRLSLPLEDT